VPADCPFDPSPALSRICFTGRHGDYHMADTIYPTWARDGHLYTPWTDGVTDGVRCSSGGNLADGFKTGQAVMKGDDPLDLEIKNISPPKRGWAAPYRGRYPCGSLVHDGVWYYGTYCLGPSAEYHHAGVSWNWPNLGPMPGFQISHDLGTTWEDSPHSVTQPLFPEPDVFLGPVKMGAPHFVDFGQNMEHSPDGKAYLVAQGSEAGLPPRPCYPGECPGEPYHLELRPGEQTSDDRAIYERAFAEVEGRSFAHGKLSWVAADQVYLARVTPSPETINDLAAYEFFASQDECGEPIWTSDFASIQPLLQWNNNMGCVTATWVPGLGKFLMCVTDGWPGTWKMRSYILEADVLTGPWRMLTYLKDFGEQAYFLNFPSKFISDDGRTLWLCYSANFTNNAANTFDAGLAINPPGGRYGLSLHEVQLGN
jgi:hypothetical protein